MSHKRLVGFSQKNFITYYCLAWLMVSDMDKTGGIPYDRCVATYFPDDYERVRQLLNVDNVHEPAYV